MYSQYLRERIVCLSKTLSGKGLVDALKEEGFKVSRSGVYHVLKKYYKDGIVYDYPRSGRPRILDERAHDRISQWLTVNS